MKEDKNNSEKTERSRRKLPDTIVKYSGLSIKMALAILGGIYLGKYIDEKMVLETPIFTLIFSLVGLTLAIVIIIKDTIGFNAKK
jgi:F0F1-type ATP synthase assembly protein I